MCVAVSAAPPALAAALAVDTGPDGIPNSDGITNDPTVSGTLTAAASIVSFKAGLNSGPVTTDALAQLSAEWREVEAFGLAFELHAMDHSGHAGFSCATMAAASARPSPEYRGLARPGKLIHAAWAATPGAGAGTTPHVLDAWGTRLQRRAGA